VLVQGYVRFEGRGSEKVLRRHFVFAVGRPEKEIKFSPRIH
jgi:hypothetical protein